MSFSSEWSESANADPISDIKAMAEYLAGSSGYKPTTLVMSAREREAYVRFLYWFEETLRRLHATPRWRFITRMALKRQVYGPLHHRYRPRTWYRVREWNRERTGFYDS